MKARYYFLITFICFVTIGYYFIVGMKIGHPWILYTILFIVGELSLAVGAGKVLRRANESHEKYSWRDEDNPNF